MADNIFEKLTDKERNYLWMYMIFNQNKIIKKTEQWTKEAEEAGMTLAEYLESINPLNKVESEDNECSGCCSWNDKWKPREVLEDEKID